MLTILKGFGVSARSTAETRKLDPTAITVFRQADIGEYLREVSRFSASQDVYEDNRLLTLTRKILCLRPRRKGQVLVGDILRWCLNPRYLVVIVGVQESFVYSIKVIAFRCRISNHYAIAFGKKEMLLEKQSQKSL